MCDYSLMHEPNRLAQAGEELVVHRFRTGSKGLIAAGEPEEVSLTGRCDWSMLLLAGVVLLAGAGLLVGGLLVKAPLWLAVPGALAGLGVMIFGLAGVTEFWEGAKSTRVPCAVCIPPGARLLLRGISERIQRELEVAFVERVTFLQLHATANSYRDAVGFSNGRYVRLQELEEGQRILVMTLDSGAGETDPAIQSLVSHQEETNRLTGRSVLLR